MKKFFLQIFTWWNGQTLGTRFFTWRKGTRVGDDEFGNIYYQNKDGSRRWVIYPGVTDPSSVPASWHGWLHYTVDELPGEQAFAARAWHRPHIANGTGTARAYRPSGSILVPGHRRPPATGDYDAWSPE